jgi:hypothetical protein
MNSALVKRRRSSKPRKTEFSAAKSRFSAPQAARRVVDEDEAIVQPPVDTLYRTKRLLLAALRVWELKNGFRPGAEAVRWAR